MKKDLSFSLEDIKLYEDDEDKDFALVELEFLSSGNNSHKNPIDIDVLKRDAHTALGKFIIGKYSNWTHDVTGHVENPDIYGYIPPNSKIKFKELENKVFACVDGVLSKLYAVPIIEAFHNQKEKWVSCEFTADIGEKDELGNEPILGYEIHGVSILGSGIKPSCAGANIQMMRFSEDKANDYYNGKTDSLLRLQTFSNEKRREMAKKNYKVNKEELKETAWGDIDKTKLRNAVMEAANRKSLVKDVYALVENGWEDAPSEHLKYPIMELQGNTFYYNRYGLASALAYAKKEEENSVINKIEKIYDKFNLNNEEGEEKNMEEEKEVKYPEADDNSTNEKDVEEVKKDEKEMSLDVNADLAAFYEMLENETDEYKDLGRRVLESEDRGLVMQDVLKMAHENAELKAFKEAKMAEAKEMEVNKILAEVKEDIDVKTFEELKEEGMACNMEDITGFANKAKALAYAATKEKDKEEKEVRQFSKMSFDVVSEVSQSFAEKAEELYRKYL